VEHKEYTNPFVEVHKKAKVFKDRVREANRNGMEHNSGMTDIFNVGDKVSYEDANTGETKYGVITGMRRYRWHY
jgi:hypothetical protein